MNANQKKEVINKALAKDGTNFDEVVRARQCYFTHLSNYLKKHEKDGKKTTSDHEMEIQWGLDETASEFNNKGTMKWLVEFLVGSCDIARVDRVKWIDYVNALTTTDCLKKAKAMVKWDIKYRREVVENIFDLIFK